jgi:hypothetical protein
MRCGSSESVCPCRARRQRREVTSCRAWLRSDAVKAAAVKGKGGKERGEGKGDWIKWRFVLVWSRAVAQHVLAASSPPPTHTARDPSDFNRSLLLRPAAHCGKDACCAARHVAPFHPHQTPGISRSREPLRSHPGLLLLASPPSTPPPFILFCLFTKHRGGIPASSHRMTSPNAL